MKIAYIRRAIQVETVSGVIKSSPYPVVLCGDFNDTPVSYCYRLIDKQLDDTFVKKGKGIGQTHAQMLPLLRLDYIFHSNSMQTIEHKTIDKDYSDHFPVVTRIQLPQ
jgi:endonuclease/exonuclease/phosphatase family metal-dependent hydrolase